MTSFSWWQQPVDHFQDWAAERFTAAAGVCAPTNHEDGGSRDTRKTQSTLIVTVTTSRVHFFLTNSIWGSKKKRIYVHCLETRRKTQTPPASCRSPPPQSWYIPLRSSLKHLQHSCSTLCFVYAFLGWWWQQDANQHQMVMCVCFVMSHDTCSNHDQGSESFQKSPVMLCIASMVCTLYNAVKREICLPQWLTLLWKKTHCCMVEPFNRSSKILLGDLQTCFQGDGVEKT